MSELAILNVGAGDTKLSFDPKDKPGREHAKRVVADMLKRGYAIMVEVSRDKDGEPLYRRVKKFDPKTCEYIVMGVPDEEEAATPARPATSETRGRGRTSTRRIKAESANAVGVARSAGG